jgi:nucleoid DNA-binding protein
MPKPAKTRESNKWIIDRIRGMGLSKDEATLAYRSVMLAIQQSILEGNRVNLWTLGTFQWRFRSGRKMPAGGWRLDEAQQADSYFLRFKVSDRLTEKIRQQLREGFLPKHIAKPRINFKKNPV